MDGALTICFTGTSPSVCGVAIAGTGTLLAREGSVERSSIVEIAARAGGWTLSSAAAVTLSLQADGGEQPLAGGAAVWPATASGTIGTEHFDGHAIMWRSGKPAGAEFERVIALALDGVLVAIRALRPRGAHGHGEERLEALVFRGDPREAAAIAIPRLSSSFDADGQLTHAGIELWETDESEFPLRIGGEARAHGELAGPDGARTAVTFLDWHQDGRRAAGSYAITRSGG